jgi:hypothetical protein
VKDGNAAEADVRAYGGLAENHTKTDVRLRNIGSPKAAYSIQLSISDNEQ